MLAETSRPDRLDLISKHVRVATETAAGEAKPESTKVPPRVMPIIPRRSRPTTAKIRLMENHKQAIQGSGTRKLT
jgi:hypothetical protein